MHRIDGAGHNNNTWVAEDPATNRPPTEITAAFMNAVQEEIAHVVEGAGIPLNKADNTQLRQAIAALIAAAATAVADATTSVKGILKLSTDAQTQAGVDTLTAVTPASLSSRIATETRTGLVEKATPAEARTFAADKFIDGALFGSVALGANQIWWDVTANRANAVTYTNSTGKPIQVLVSFADTNNLTATYTVNVGGVNIINALTYDASGAYWGSSVASFIVPNGTTYAVSFTNANISKWSELRS